jgi:Ca2+-binding RTX toxin-like protein
VVFDIDAGTLTGEGSDTFKHIEMLQGSHGDDTFTGDPTYAPIVQVDGYGGHDVLDFSHGVANGQTVFLGPDTPTSALWAFGIAEVIGSPFRDRFVFTSGDVPASFDGGRGNDRLVGGPLDDTLIGDRGADRVIGKGGADTCPDGPGADTVTGCELH